MNVNRKEKDFLLKTDVDYTVCSKKDKPLMCIEFDGLSGGYNRGAKYIQKRKDPLRKKKLELKLKIAKEHDFPFYIISYDERDYISEDIHLTVLDGIIGQTLVKKNLENKVHEYLDSDEDLKFMTESDYHEYVEDLIMGAQLELEWEWDPIVKKTGEINNLLLKKGISPGYRIFHSSIPELPDIKDMFDFEGIIKRVEAWGDIEWRVCEIINEDLGVKDRAMVRNFEGIHASPLRIVENIAKLLFYYELSIKFGLKRSANT